MPEFVVRMVYAYQKIKISICTVACVRRDIGERIAKNKSIYVHRHHAITVVNVAKQTVPIIYASVRIDLSVNFAKLKRAVAPAIIVTTAERVSKRTVSQFVNVLKVLLGNFVKFDKITVRIIHAKVVNASIITMVSNASAHRESLENDVICGHAIICHAIKMHIALIYRFWALRAAAIVVYVRRGSKETHVHKSNHHVNRIHVKTMHNAFQQFCGMDRQQQ